ncbi:unnamed protein product [Bursaphelenchus okinawaensis]|uniref:MFS domain-containing protein n=1 Tax=Bursaphelenchus okinawaensis TaxID=465554 RepID=A0A811K1V5_9BILA|nr:unnamed protein product [Bursaphelenchus okinawaensis]CAG9089748.1 unnamed protein product [Bursaphelenchus okinawaensis]
MYPYMQIVDKNITETFFGAIVSAYSIGQIVASPLFGYWSNKIRRVTPPLYLGLTMMLLGNALYITMPLIGLPNRYLLLFGRLITGIGSGNVALLRTYASTASTIKDRSHAIAFVTCGQALGMVFGPGMALLKWEFVETYVGIVTMTRANVPGSNDDQKKEKSSDYEENDEYYVEEKVEVKEDVKGVETKKEDKKVEKNEEKKEKIEKEKSKEEKVKKKVETEEEINLPEYDKIAVFICDLTRFVDVFVRTNLEALGAAFAMMMFNLTEHEAVFYNSAAQGTVGFLTFFIYLLYIFFNLDQHFNMRIGCMLSLLALVLFNLLTFSWPFLPRLDEKYALNDTIGCNQHHFHWCTSLNSVNFYIYYLSYAIVIGLAFPILTITMNTLFSRILGPRRQGTEQGVLQGCSGLARLTGPVLASTLYTNWGPRPVWCMEIIVILIVFGCWGKMYHRMVPFEEKVRKDSTVGSNPYLNMVEKRKCHI